MPHLLNRIASHKKSLAAICSAGLAKGQRGNPAASLRVHTLHATPVLLSGVASLVLTNSEMKVLENHYKTTVQKLQRLHPNTPRAVVFFLAGCLPLEALVHLRQLSLFSMICHLPQDPLHKHAQHILSYGSPKNRSCFFQIKDICSQYGLKNPVQLLRHPIKKEAFKNQTKKKVTEYWEAVLRTEAAPLKSLLYFKRVLYSLTRPHYMWLAAASNPYECSKSTILLRMASGRYRTEVLCRYWSDNRSGNCRAPSCYMTPGTLEHLLVVCPALDRVRQRLYTMWLEKSVMFPTLHATIRHVLNSNESTKVQFILEPLAFQDLFACAKLHGQNFIEQLSYLTRTYAFYLHREYRRVIQGQTELPPPYYPSITINYNTNTFSVSATCANQLPLNPSSAKRGQNITSLVTVNHRPSNVSTMGACDMPTARVLSTVASPSASPTLLGGGLLSIEGEDYNTTNPAIAYRARQTCTANYTTSSEPSNMAMPQQYQDCPGGFCGGLCDHNCHVQVSSTNAWYTVV